MARREKRWGLVQHKHDSRYYKYRDPLRPERTVMMFTSFRMVPIPDHEWQGKSVPGFDVWLKSRKPTIHFVAGDMLDALAVAAAIIHAPKGKPYGSEKEKE